MGCLLFRAAWIGSFHGHLMASAECYTNELKRRGTLCIELFPTCGGSCWDLSQMAGVLYGVGEYSG